jgi:chromosome segregation ATPase
LRIIEENRRQDNKRITDIQGEVAAIRKRQDEVRGKQDLVSDNMRKLENRINDLLVAESERKEAQTAFIEKLNMVQVNYDRTFKQWAERFDAMDQITSDIEEEISGLENIQRSVKQSQSALDESTQRFDRRVNEITEVQRLNEDRFRQEWTTFRSDYEKRWSNYTLSQEEQYTQINRDQESLTNRITTLEENIVDLSENLQSLGKDDIKRMKSLLTILRDSLESYNSYFKE